MYQRSPLGAALKLRDCVAATNLDVGVSGDGECAGVLGCIGAGDVEDLKA